MHRYRRSAPVQYLDARGSQSRELRAVRVRDPRALRGALYGTFSTEAGLLGRNNDSVATASKYFTERGKVANLWQILFSFRPRFSPAHELDQLHRSTTLGARRCERGQSGSLGKVVGRTKKAHQSSAAPISNARQTTAQSITFAELRLIAKCTVRQSATHRSQVLGAHACDRHPSGSPKGRRPCEQLDGRE